ncbi:MAG: phage baseplate assembly protein V [Candidatus Binataceae bacterium]
MVSDVPSNAIGCFRVGIVSAQDPASARVRVVFPDRDQLQSWWLPIVVAKTHRDKMYYLPDVGEQVVCLMDAHDEDGAVLGAIYSTVDQTPAQSLDKFQISFADGSAFEYDRGVHALSVTLAGGATFALSANGASVKLDASGNLILTAAGEIELGGSGLKAVARLGDEVSVGGQTGTIVSASSKVFAE